MPINEMLFFAVFALFILGMLTLDLTVIGRGKRVMSFREATIWSGVWVSCALIFYVFLYFYGEVIHGISTMEHLRAVTSIYAPNLKLVEGDLAQSIELYRHNLALTFITGYLIEYSLSVDNIFVFIMILSAFSVRAEHQKQVLFWGIVGAIVLRCIFIFVGSALVVKFQWILYIFGAFLVYTGAHMFATRHDEEKIEPEHHWLVRFLSNHFAVYPRYVANKFFVRNESKLCMTPLFIVLVVIAFTDLMFALDSIPAIFAVSIDPFIVFFANIFAVNGLRSMFFMLMKIVDRFHYLKAGVSFLLIFVGLKLLGHEWLDEIGFHTVHSLYVIVSILVGSIGISMLFPKKDTTLE